MLDELVGEVKPGVAQVHVLVDQVDDAAGLRHGATLQSRGKFISHLRGGRGGNIPLRTLLLPSRGIYKKGVSGPLKFEAIFVHPVEST